MPHWCSRASLCAVRRRQLHGGSRNESRSADSWPQFRGPNGSGRPNVDAPLPHEIGPQKNRDLVDRASRGPFVPGRGGRSHLPDGRTGQASGHAGARSRRAASFSGNATRATTIWRKFTTSAATPRPSPVADNERVVCFFGSCGLVCYDHARHAAVEAAAGAFQKQLRGGQLADSRGQPGDSESGPRHRFVPAWPSTRRAAKSCGRPIGRNFRAAFRRPSCGTTRAAKRSSFPAACGSAPTAPTEGSELWTVHGSARTCSMTPVVGSDGTLFVTEWTPGGDENDRIVADPFDEIAARYDANKNNQLERNELPPGPLVEPLRSDRPRQERPHHGPRVQLGAEHLQLREEWRRWRSARALAETRRPPTSAGSMPRISRTSPRPCSTTGRLYMIKSGGIVSCVDAADGKLLKQKRAPGSHEYFSSPVIGDGNVADRR